MSIAGRQPIATASQPNTSNYLQQFSPNAVMGYNAQNYGNYSNAYSSMYGANASLAGSQNQMWGNIAGGAMGGLGTFSAAKWGTPA